MSEQGTSNTLVSVLRSDDYGEIVKRSDEAADEIERLTRERDGAMAERRDRADNWIRYKDERDRLARENVELRRQHSKLRAALEEILRHDPHPQAQHVARKALEGQSSGARATPETTADVPLSEQEFGAMLAKVRDLLGPEKAQLWWEAPNPMLGNVRPWLMALSGKQRARKLYKLIDDAYMDDEAMRLPVKASDGR